MHPTSTRAYRSFPIFMLAAATLAATLGACGSSTRPVSADGGHAVDQRSVADLVIFDQLGSDATTPLDLPAGCGTSWLDGSLASPYFELGCPPSDVCPIRQTMTLSAKTGYFLSEGRGCSLTSGYMLDAVVELVRRSTVTLTLGTAVKMASETSFRDLCTLRQCSDSTGTNTMVLDAGEYTVEVLTEKPGAFELTITILPYRK